MEDYNFNTGLLSSDSGIVVFLDLDGFGNCMDEMGWVRWSPNPITGFLTQETLKFIKQLRAVHLWGLNEKEGTEEALLIFYQDDNLVFKLLEDLRSSIKQLAIKLEAPTSLSIGTATGKITNIKPIKHHRKKEFMKDPTIYLAYKALKDAKKKGGDCIIRY